MLGVQEGYISLFKSQETQFEAPSATRTGWPQVWSFPGPFWVWLPWLAQPCHAEGSGGHQGWAAPLVAPFLAKKGHREPRSGAWSSQAPTPLLRSCYLSIAVSDQAQVPAPRDALPVSSPDQERASVPRLRSLLGRPQPSPISGVSVETLDIQRPLSRDVPSV